MTLQLVPRTGTDVVVNGFTVDLTRQERVVLDALMAAHGEYVSADRLVAMPGSPPSSASVRVIVHRIRNKLTDHGLADPIESARGRSGLGWRWAL